MAIHEEYERLDDDDLMEKTRTGDTFAFGELILRYQREVLSLAHSISRNPADAEDIVQEAFLRIFRNREHYEARGQFFFYLRRIVINLSLNFLKKREPSFSETRENGVPSTEQEFENKECVLKALATLDSVSQSLLILREWEGLNYKTISEIMEMSLSNTKVSLHRAREKFRKALLVYFPEENLS
jgi:RNA polymerase sigma-70 factor (ECF subfamily)